MNLALNFNILHNSKNIPPSITPYISDSICYFAHFSMARVPEVVGQETIYVTYCSLTVSCRPGLAVKILNKKREFYRVTVARWGEERAHSQEKCQEGRVLLNTVKLQISSQLTQLVQGLSRPSLDSSSKKNVPSKKYAVKGSPFYSL